MTKARSSWGLWVIPSLAAIFCLSFPAYAKYAGGTGEPNDPYLIYTAEQMNEIGLHQEDWNKHFKLMADIDLSAYKGDEFNIIGNPPLWFCGTFDGAGHRISNLIYHSVDRNNVGLFGWVWDQHGSGIIKDLGLIDVSIDAGSGSSVGALVGSLWGGTVTGCYVYGGTIFGNDAVGGLVGGFSEIPPPRSNIQQTPNGQISQCFTCCRVSGNSYVGGLAGSSIYEISNCYSNSDVFGYTWPGGLVGENLGYINNCYAAGHIQGDVLVGGLVGIGYPSDVANSFWDLEVSDWQVSAGGIPKTTAEMQMLDTYVSAGWNLVGESENGAGNIWKLCEGLDYPHLAWEKYGGGMGTTSDPFRICTAEQFKAVGEDPNDWDKSFKLMTDINLTELRQNVVVIGNEELPFTGTFDGNGKAISGFTYNSITGDYIGLFGHVKGVGAKIKNLGLVGPDIFVGMGHYVGAVVGYLDHGSLEGCYVQGGKVSGDYETGGLVGHNFGYVLDCHSSCELYGNYNVGGLIGVNRYAVTNSSSVGLVKGYNTAGGLVGQNKTPQEINSCFSTGAVSAYTIAGGLVGENDGTIRNCYAMGDVSGHQTVGGLVGSSHFGNAVAWNCYSTGRITAERTSDVSALGTGYETYSSFWDMETSGQSESRYGTGKTTTEMQMASTFVGWGCDSAWTIDEGVDYPRLSWENMPGQLITTPSFQNIAGSGTVDDPYKIYTARQLNQIGLFPCEWTRHYSLEEDIDLSSLDSTLFNIIGSENIRFRGVFCGNGHTISNFSYSKYRHYTGLFGSISYPAIIERVILVNPSIEIQYVLQVGALAGKQYGATVRYCGVEGGNIHCNRNVGGLIGMSSGGMISQCYSICNVSGEMEIGGLVGSADQTNITDCYAKGTVIATSDSAGGLVGWYYSGSIKNCYSTGQVVASRDYGGLAGRSSRTDYEGCLWDIQTSGCWNSALGTGRLTPYMKQALTFVFAGWDFVWEDIIGTEDIWCICEGQDYPKLTWQFTVGDFDGDGDVDFGDYGILTSRWHQTDGSFWCGEGGTDFTYDGYVDMSDLAKFAENWLGSLSN